MDDKLTNWAGNYTYSVYPLPPVGTEGQVRDLVRKYDRIKVLGTRHCFNNIADSRDQLISLAGMNGIVSLDKHRHRVTVEAGIRYGELAVFLNDNGFALHNLASLPHISVAGGCITGTHGSGIHNGNLSTAVTGLTFITALGETVELSLEKDPDLFQGAVVNLGGLGVITHMTLAIQPAFQVRQYVYENLSMEQLEHHFDDIMGAAYSVSLFTDWRNKNINEVWLKSKTGEPSIFFGAHAATENLHPIRDISAEHCTEQLGVPGPWHERLPHFRMGFTPSSGKELQTEYFVPREHSYEAIMAVEKLASKISPHLFITEIRCVAADELWMSPAYQQDSTAIHFTWKPEWAAVSQLLPQIEAALAPFYARPHWGKLNTIPHARLASLYKKMPEFQHLLQHYDPKGKFRNEYLDKVIFGC